MLVRWFAFQGSAPLKTNESGKWVRRSNALCEAHFPQINLVDILGFLPSSASPLVISTYTRSLRVVCSSTSSRRALVQYHGSRTNFPKRGELLATGSRKLRLAVSVYNSFRDHITTTVAKARCKTYGLHTSMGHNMVRKIRNRRENYWSAGLWHALRRTRCDREWTF